MADRPATGPDDRHPLLVAIAPLVDRLGAELVDPRDVRPDDVPLRWEGELLAGVRLAAAPAAGAESGAEGGSEPAGLEALIEEVSRELGGPLHALDRAGKQRAVRLLEERGAFHYRRSAETLAEALGVTRFTVYNYLNRSRA